MATFEEQILNAWNEWEETTGAEANNPDDFIAWAMENKKLAPRLQDIRRIFRKQVTRALRNATRRDPDGYSYRAKQCVMNSEGGMQLRLWFDTDKGGTPTLRQKAVRQRRDGIVADVYRAICDVQHMNKVFTDDPQLNFVLDFNDDVAERRAAEALDQDKEDDEAA
jgi:hypothetical protein